MKRAVNQPVRLRTFLLLYAAAAFVGQAWGKIDRAWGALPTIETAGNEGGPVAP